MTPSPLVWRASNKAGQGRWFPMPSELWPAWNLLLCAGSQGLGQMLQRQLCPLDRVLHGLCHASVQLSVPKASHTIRCKNMSYPKKFYSNYFLITATRTEIFRINFRKLPDTYCICVSCVTLPAWDPCPCWIIFYYCLGEGKGGSGATGRGGSEIPGGAGRGVGGCLQGILGGGG